MKLAEIAIYRRFNYKLLEKVLEKSCGQICFQRQKSIRFIYSVLFKINSITFKECYVKTYYKQAYHPYDKTIKL